MTLEDIAGRPLPVAYIECGIKAGFTKTKLAAMLGVSVGRLGQWRRGERSIPPTPQTIMRRFVLQALMGPVEGYQLADVLTPPTLKKKAA